MLICDWLVVIDASLVGIVMVTVGSVDGSGRTTVRLNVREIPAAVAVNTTV
jgi:hypothetical protein